MLKSLAQGKQMAKSLDPASKPKVKLEQLTRSEKFKLANPLIRAFVMPQAPGNYYKAYKGFQYWKWDDWEVFKEIVEELMEIRMRSNLKNPAEDEKIILKD